ncbi:MAG TPA: aminoacyl-tRNA hydrolase [Chthoniobacterales bacterium]|nr:aminoacyl-tRNA hydrolase [Chthoniobacterales bacterium]
MPAEPAPIRMVVGLGNPGAEYERTRHNVGFVVLDRLAADSAVEWQRSAKWGAYWAKTDQALLVKPMTYMNRSGGPSLALAQFYKVAPSEMLVVLDELALELGRLRIRLKGSPGGHNGLESIITTFGTEEIPRLRIGIGAAPGGGAVDWVLGRFFEEEMPAVDRTIERAVDAVKAAIDKGVVSAMNTFNKNPES